MFFYICLDFYLFEFDDKKLKETMKFKKQQ